MCIEDALERPNSAVIFVVGMVNDLADHLIAGTFEGAAEIRVKLWLVVSVSPALLIGFNGRQAHLGWYDRRVVEGPCEGQWSPIRAATMVRSSGHLSYEARSGRHEDAARTRRRARSDLIARSRTNGSRIDGTELRDEVVQMVGVDRIVHGRVCASRELTACSEQTATQSSSLGVLNEEKGTAIAELRAIARVNDDLLIVSDDMLTCSVDWNGNKRREIGWAVVERHMLLTDSHARFCCIENNAVAKLIGV